MFTTKVMELDTDIGRRSEVASTIGEPNVSLTSLLARRKWPIVVLFLMFVVGMAFMFEWNPVVHHWKAWDTGGDLWGIYRGAHYVGWGFIGGIYDPSTGVITFPGMSVLLAPVAMFGGKLHLSESFLPYYLPHPTTALLLQPIELLLASTVVFASDSLAERLHIAKSRRIALCVLIGIVAWPTAAIWGHAEDALAMTFAIYAMVAMLNSKWSKCGWLFGFGIVIQPLVALTIPLFIAASPPGKTTIASHPVGGTLICADRDRVRRRCGQYLPCSGAAADTTIPQPRNPMGRTCPSAALWRRPNNARRFRSSQNGTICTLASDVDASSGSQCGGRPGSVDRRRRGTVVRTICLATPATFDPPLVVGGGPARLPLLFRGCHDSLLPGAAPVARTGHCLVPRRQTVLGSPCDRARDNRVRIP